MTAAHEDGAEGRATPSWLGPVRLVLGLLQGLALWWLYRSAEAFGWLCDEADQTRCLQPFWPATVPELFGPLTLILLFVPVLALAGVGRMRWTTLAAWAAVATALLALMGWHEVARQSSDALHGPPYINGPMPLFAAAALFIGHHLVLAADMERRWIAPFAVYFDTAWKAGVQLVLSIGFTGAFWVLLFLGAALFRIIGLDFLEDLTRKDWFYIPVTTLAFATAVHLTDVRDGLIRGVRTVGLMLLSWLLLVMTVLAAGFVLALPFTGLKGLWDTGSGTSLVLAAAAALIVLINAAYQDGRPENRPPLPVRLAVQVGALLLAPLVVIAFFGLALRIGQHGLTPDRIIALACALVGAVFAAGYGWASLRTFLRKGDWMRPLEPTTLAGAVVAFGLIVALFSPLLDPARLSVADQVARLERGAVTPEKFDYDFLRFGSGKAGQAALARLARSTDPAVRTHAAAALAEGALNTDPGPKLSPVTARIRANPEGVALPASFIDQDRRFLYVLDHCTEDAPCQARIFDLDRDGASEVIVAGRRAISVFRREEDGLWFEWAVYHASSCADPTTDLGSDFAAGRFRTAPPVFPDLIVGDARLRHEEGEPECPSAEMRGPEQDPVRVPESYPGPLSPLP